MMETPKKRGRPRVSEPRSTVSTWVTVSQHDRLVRLADQHGVSVSTVVKSLVMITLPKVERKAT